jgi:hypothetical protein
LVICITFAFLTANISSSSSFQARVQRPSVVGLLEQRMAVLEAQIAHRSPALAAAAGARSAEWA